MSDTSILYLIKYLGDLKKSLKKFKFFTWFNMDIRQVKKSEHQ